MANNKDFIYQALVNHLYFGGTIRSFCTTIGLTFYKNNQDYIDRAILLGYEATDIVNMAISYMDKELANEVLEEDVYITKYTKDILLLTEKLFGVNLQISVDNDIKILKDKNNEYSDDVVSKINDLTEKGMLLVNKFNDFVKEIKTKIDNQELFSYLYPDFFNYMYEEISVYGRLI